MDPRVNETDPQQTEDNSALSGQREYRLGPFVFVTGWRSGPEDPWAHRRAEPRVFALCWATYVMGAALLTLFASRPGGYYALSHYEYGARALFLITTVGATILAPMVRLSQARAPRPIRGTIVDFLVVILPTQAMIWPFPLLTNWPLSTVAALALTIASWTLLSFAIAAIALASRRMSRNAAMLCILACVGGVPALTFLSRLLLALEPIPLGAMLSPLTAAYDLTLTPPGVIPYPSRTQVLLAAAPLVPAFLALLLALPTRRTRPAKRLD